MSASDPADRRPGPERPRGSAAPPAQAARVLLLRDFDRGTLVAVRHEVERLCGLWGLTGLGLYRFVVAGAAGPEQLPDPGRPEGRGLWLARQNVARLTLHSAPAGTTIELEAS